MKDTERIHLSEHFILYEFTRSGCAIEHDLSNMPDTAQQSNLQALCRNILEPLRRQFGPIIITSGFRSREVNRLVGGAPSSQHLRGEAADILVTGTEDANRKYAFILRNLDFDQLILEPIGAERPRWIHVSYTRRHKNRHATLNATPNATPVATPSPLHV